MTIPSKKNKAKYRTSERRRESSVGQRQPMTEDERRAAEAEFDLVLQSQVIDGSEFLTLRGAL
jgi:hypothetical protein